MWMTDFFFFEKRETKDGMKWRAQARGAADRRMNIRSQSLVINITLPTSLAREMERKAS
jgi:hypothetical protein